MQEVETAEQAAFSHFFVSRFPANKLKMLARLEHLAENFFIALFFYEFNLFVDPPRLLRAAFYKLLFKGIEIS